MTLYYLRMRPLALSLVLLVAAIAVAEERYVPIAIGTELQITNATSLRNTITIELLGGDTTRVEVDAGETIHWTAPADEGVLRIDGDVQITAASQRDQARASLPVVAARDAVDEANIQPHAPWRSSVLAINPSASTAFVMIDDTLHTIAPHGVLRVDGASVVRARTPLLLFACDTNEENGARVFTPIANATKRKRRAVRSITPAPPQTQTIVLTPSKDNTLFENNIGSISNGAGVHVFAGITRSGFKRRALVAFDVAGQIPPGSHITRAALTVTVSKTVSGAEPATLRRVTKNWGEGTSNAGAFSDGGGAEAVSGDATWLHTSFPSSTWTSPGGDFDATADATTPVASTGTWESAAMITRVQQWLDQPATNFGWIVLGNESRTGSAKRLDSREVQPETTRPSLTIEYQH